MKSIKKILLIGALLAGTYLGVQAQADFCLSLQNETLTLNMLSQADYTAPPANFWNSTVFTIRYPATATVTWSGFTKSTALNISEDPSTIPAINGGDGFFYKKFFSADAAVIENFTTGSTNPLFSINFTSDQTLTFELVSSNAWTAGNNGDLTFNNAQDGNIANAVLNTCGTQTYIVAAAIVDADNDGVMSDTDPNDADPCVPNACQVNNCPPNYCFRITATR